MAIRFNSFFILCLFCALCVFTHPSAIAQSQTFDERPEQLLAASNNTHFTSRYLDGEELFLSLVVDKYSLGEITTQVQDSQFYLSLDDLITSANFAIDVKRTTGEVAYSGWWSNRSNTFSLLLSADLANEENYTQGAIAIATLGDESFSLTQSDIIEINKEIYVRAALVEKWFNTSITFDETELQAISETFEPWPFQQEQARENARVQSINQVGNAQEPHHDYGYGLQSPLALDLIVGARARQTTNGSDDVVGNYSVLGRQDLLGLSTRFFFAGDSNDLLSQGTVDFSRVWLGENDGPLGIRSLNFGDVQGVRVGNVSASARRGIYVSNQRLDNETQQQQTNITGIVQAGWDVELYQNDVLIAQLFNIEDGRFEFLDIPLFIGENRFEVVKYGPQGEIESEKTVKVLDGSFDELFKPSYELSLTQNNSSLLGIQDNSLDEESGYSIDGRYGVSLAKNLGLNFGHSIGIKSLSDNVYTAGAVYRPFDRLLFDAEFQLNDNVSQQFSLSARTNYLNQAISARIAQSRGIATENKDDQTTTANITASGSLLKTKPLSVFHQTDLSTSRLSDSNVFYSVNNRLSLNFNSFSFNHNLNFSKRSQSVNEDEESIIGGFSLNSALGRVSARAGGAYFVDDNEFTWDSAFISANWFALGNYVFNAEVAHSFTAESTRYSLGIDWKKDLFSLSSQITHSDALGSSFNINGRISFAEAPTEFGYIQDRFSLANTGTLLVRVYHDTNNNRIYDADDIPLEGVKVEAVQSRKRAKTDVIGIAQMEGLRNFTKTDVLIDKDSVDNPYLVQSTLNTSITPRPGLVSLLNYPMVEGAEIDGEVSFNDEYGRVQYLANVPLEILDGRGNIVEEFKTGFDGYFYYLGLVPHTYSLRVAPAFLEKFKFESFSPITLAVNNQGEQIAGLDLKLQKKKEVKGYIVHSGVFEKESSLNTYYEIFVRRNSQLINSLDTKPFKHYLNSGKLSLGVKFVRTKLEADLTCLWFKQHFNNCSISDHSYFVSQIGS